MEGVDNRHVGVRKTAMLISRHSVARYQYIQFACRFAGRGARVPPRLPRKYALRVLTSGRGTRGGQGGHSSIGEKLHVKGGVKGDGQ